MKLNNIILVPTDFSDVCHNAIDYAVKMAGKINFKVIIYHVINKTTQAYFKVEEGLNEKVAEKLQSIIDGFKMQSEIEMSYAYEEGSIFDLIHKKADEVGANFIVLGTHGKVGFQKIFGSHALKVITQSKAATIVVQKKKFRDLNNVLFPVNSFTEARQKVQYAIAMHQRFNSHIHIYKEQVDNSIDQSRIDVITKQIVEEFKKEKIPYTVHISQIDGETARELVDFSVANEIDAIMIVTETKLGSGIFSLGPWNEKIMFNEAQIPAICINPVQHGFVYFDL
ncbi:MAG TPA: universal stress protein [Bacteroidales bacterium]|nr:universal stress protein [Bacteroidales bacterium]HRX98033.1 universal stress protein [Bacteroidales bacterium]